MMKKQKILLTLLLAILLLTFGMLLLRNRKLEQERVFAQKQFRYRAILLEAEEKIGQCGYLQAEELLNEGMQYLPEEPEAYRMASDLQLMQHDVEGAWSVLEGADSPQLDGEKAFVTMLREMQLMQNGFVSASQLGGAHGLLQARLIDLDADGCRELITVTLSDGKLQPSAYQHRNGQIETLADFEPLAVNPLNAESSGEAYFHAFLLPEQDGWYLGYSAYYDPWKFIAAVDSLAIDQTTVMLPDETTIQLSDAELANHAGSGLYLYRLSAEGIELVESYDANHPDEQEWYALQTALKTLGLAHEGNQSEEPYFHLTDDRQQGLLRMHLTGEGAELALSWQAPAYDLEEEYAKLAALCFEASQWWREYQGVKPPRLWNGTLLSLKQAEYRILERDLNGDGCNELYLLRDGELYCAWAYNGYDLTCFIRDGMSAQLYEHALKIGEGYFVPNQWGVLQTVQPLENSDG